MIAVAVMVAAVVIPVTAVAVAAIAITMLGVERPIAIAFVGLCRALQAGECQQAESSRAKREKLRTHWELLSMGREGGRCPALSTRTAVPNRNDRPHLELELDNEILRKNLRTQDPVIILALLSTIHLAEPGAMELIEDVVELRARRAPEEELWAWSELAKAYLRKLIGDGPVDARPLMN